MIRILVLLALCTLSLPAWATEILINYPSKAALVQMATALGYYDATAKSIVAQARVDAGGDYFFNNVGQFIAVPAVVDPVTRVETSPAILAPGLWARLRHNADPQRLIDKITAAKSAADSLGIKIYRQLPVGPNGTLCWSADNSTCGPAYLDLIGVIA